MTYFYRNILLGKLNAKRQRRQERKAKEVDPSGTLSWKNQTSVSAFTITSGSPGNLSNGAPAVGVNRSASSSSMYKTKKKKNEQDLKRKLTKDDISLPSNFRYSSILFHIYYLDTYVYFFNMYNNVISFFIGMWHTWDGM